MIFEKLEYKSIYGKYIVKYLEEEVAIGHNMFYVKYILRDFDCFLTKNNNDKGINKQIIDKWLEKKSTECLATRKTRATVLKQFLVFLSNYIEDVYIVNTKQYYKGDKPLPYIFTNIQIKKMFNKIMFISKEKARVNQKIFEIVVNILYCCGTRITETLLLKLKDIDFTNKCLTINNGKGKKERIVPLNDYIFDLLIDFLNRYCQNYMQDDYIFKNIKNNKPISRVTILNYFHEVCNELDIHTKDNKLPRIHDLRHTYIVHCITKLENENKNINAYLSMISTMVGHEDIKNTMYYLRFTPERINTINIIENNSHIIIPRIGADNE